MENEKDSSKDCKDSKKCCRGGFFGGAYGLGFIGALVFYIQQADTFWVGVIGFLKSLVWPAILVYKLLESLV